MTAPELWWSPKHNAVVGKHKYGECFDLIEQDDLGWRDTEELSEPPADAVRLVPQPVVRYSELRKRIESTRHRYWGKGGEVNVTELIDQILSFLHDAGVSVRSDQYVGGPARPRGAAPVPDNTTETHDGS